MSISTSPNKHKNEDSLVFGEVKFKSYWSDVKQNKPTEFFAFPKLQFRVKHDFADNGKIFQFPL